MAAQHKREPFDWYVEPAYAVEALADRLPFDGVIWDPACGRGTVPAILRERGLDVHGSDICDRGGGAVGDFFLQTAAPDGRQPDWIVTNPPYNYRKGICEAFIRKALTMARRGVCVFVPVAFKSSIGRFDLFTSFRPSHELVFSQRPSCPPGRLLDALGDDAFKHGQLDYIWLAWTRDAAGQWTGAASSYWVPPIAAARLWP